MELVIEAKDDNAELFKDEAADSVISLFNFTAGKGFFDEWCYWSIEEKTQ